jgi:chloride channel 7
MPAGFGQFTTKKYILFQIEDGIDINILAIIPSVLLGVMGGLLGSLFVFLHLKFAKLRRRIQANISNTRNRGRSI